MPIEITEEMKIEHELKFNAWNDAQDEKGKITKRTPYMEDFPNPIFNQRLVKNSIGKDGSSIESASAKIEAKLPNGRQMGFNEEMPSVVCRNGFKTKKVKGQDVRSIAVTLYRSNPDHLKYINNMLWLRRKAAEHIIFASKDYKPSSKEPEKVEAKFSKIFRYEEVDNIEDENSEKVFYYLNPLDYTNPESGEVSRMQFFLPGKKINTDGTPSNQWEEVPWEALLDQPFGFEGVPKIKVQKLFHGAQFALTTKCTSIVIHRIFPIEKGSGQEETLKTAAEDFKTREDLVAKFGAIMLTKEKAPEKVVFIPQNDVSLISGVSEEPDYQASAPVSAMANFPGVPTASSVFVPENPNVLNFNALKQPSSNEDIEL